MNGDQVAVVGDVVVLDAVAAAVLLAAAQPMLDAYRRRREPPPRPLADLIAALNQVAPRRPADPEPAVDVAKPDTFAEVDEAAWCSSTEAAIAIGVSVRQVRRLAAAGDLTARIVAGRLLVDVDDVEAVAAQRHRGRLGTPRDIVDDLE